MTPEPSPTGSAGRAAPAAGMADDPFVDMSRAGDLGRRLHQRRIHLNLSIAKVADHAGIDPGYLSYVESTPTAAIPSSTLRRLAIALDIPELELLGGGQNSPPGRDEGPGGSPLLAELRQAECADLISRGGIGRLIFQSSGRLLALPVNFGVLDGNLIYRSSSDGAISAIAPTDPVSFEVDRIDEALSSGWSVIATGSNDKVDDTDIARVDALGIEPWADGDRRTYFRFKVRSLAGRRIKNSR